MTGAICNHIRMFNNEIVYSRNAQDEFSYCVYCYSRKKKKQTITLISNIRDYKDEENNEVLLFCEGNNLTVRLVDYENYFDEYPCVTNMNIDDSSLKQIKDLVDKEEKVFLIDQEIFPISEFFEIFEKRILSNFINLECINCGRKVNTYIHTNQCIGCLSRISESREISRNPHIEKNQHIASLFSNRKKQNNPYHFVQKLKLLQHLRYAHVSNLENNQELIKRISYTYKINNLNISFKKKQEE
jgi:hypothetical protein